MALIETDIVIFDQMAAIMKIYSARNPNITNIMGYGVAANNMLSFRYVEPGAAIVADDITNYLSTAISSADSRRVRADRIVLNHTIGRIF